MSFLDPLEGTETMPMAYHQCEIKKADSLEYIGLFKMVFRFMPLLRLALAS
jgi:hypothetical protein